MGSTTTAEAEKPGDRERADHIGMIEGEVFAYTCGLCKRTMAVGERCISFCVDAPRPSVGMSLMVCRKCLGYSARLLCSKS